MAFEWHWLKSEGANSHVGRMHPMLRSIVVDAIFRHTSKGYCDWRLFTNSGNFLVAVSDYVHPQAAHIITDTGLDLVAGCSVMVQMIELRGEEKISATPEHTTAGTCVA